MKYVILSILSGGILAIVGIAFYKTYTEELAKTGASTSTITSTLPSADLTISYFDSTRGFEPANATTSVGKTILIVNNDTSNIVRAVSNPHPIHNLTPDFDSDNMEAGEFYLYTTKQKGEIVYHNHFSPGKFGVIVVE